MSETASAAPDEPSRGGGRFATALEPTLRGLRSAFPPARVVWIALAVLAVNGLFVLRGLGLGSLLVLPIVGVGFDLVFQRARFSSLRFSDAAIATSLFVALILPPTVGLLAGGAATAAAVGFRHVLRYRGRPVLNPAATGVLLASLLFYAAPAWWVAAGSLGLWLVSALGLVLILRSPSAWRIPATFFLAYGLLAGLEHLFFGGATSPQVLLLTLVDPATLFFGLFMLVEPRTAPADPGAHPMYAGTVAIGAAFLPVVLPSIGILVGLVLGNVVAVGVRASAARRAASPGTGGGAPAPRRRPGRTRFPVGQRVTVAVLLLLLLGISASLVPAPDTRPPIVAGSPAAVTTGAGAPPSNCASDNPAIPASERSSLHSMLGPSVLLTYQPNTGVVVFYDPVNHVTVTETDLYEDYGYAEFNGDDFAVSGCVP
ncbi:MAG TPA: hypothetical protein VFF67_00100 [Thermoplasmata archaeon]|nr:hypothetical protein [Thermoplasmata archaeon]